VRYSFIAWIGCALVGVAACADGEPLGSGGAPTAGKSGAGGSSQAGAGGTAGKSTGSGGKANAGSSGTGAGASGTGGSGRGGSGGSGNMSSGGSGTGGRGGSGNAGTGGAGTGGSGNAGTGGAGTGGAGTGGAGTGGAGGSEEAGAGGIGDAGAAGSADAGAGGEPGSGCPSGELACGDRCVDPGDRALDQNQLDMAGSLGLSVDQRPGQSFTVGAAGLLAGIEVAVGPCNGADTSGQIRLELFDSNASSLGQVAIEQASLPDVCGGEPLVAETVGAGYFDLTPLCLSVGAGDRFTFMLSVAGNAPVTCNQATYTCSSGENFCEDDRDCRGFFYVGVTACGGVGCDVGPNDYTGGINVMQNPTSGAFTPEPAFDLTFKTFIQ
jgi:hypothetical protein